MPRPTTNRHTTTSITVSKTDKDFLKKTVYDLSRLNDNTNQSELYALGVSLLRKQSSGSLKKLLHRERTASH